VTTQTTINEALGLIADGHAVYSEETAMKVLFAFDLPYKASYAFEAHSEPGVFKGLMLNDESLEGTRMVAALTLGSVVCDALGIKAEGKLGRGSQGQAYADAIRRHVEAVRNGA
jgi:hypothetical protein